MIPDHYTKIWLFHQKSIENWLFRVPGSLNSCWTFVHQKILGGIRILRRFPSLISRKLVLSRSKIEPSQKNRVKPLNFGGGTKFSKSRHKPLQEAHVTWGGGGAWPGGGGTFEMEWDGWWIYCEKPQKWAMNGCLAYIGDEILPNYIGIIINHYKDPY